MTPLITTSMMNYESTGLPQKGDVLASKYRIDGILGMGGMAVVLAATHLALDDRVAIKMLLPECADDAETVERFMQEGRAATRIRSEHVVRVLDVDVADGRPYLVLEFLDGVDLEKLVATKGPLPIERAVDFVLQACEALGEAHAAGIIHRDLKPANLFLCHRADGSACVKVLDFGISKVPPREPPRDSGLHALGTLPRTVMGSPHYMSPEQMMSSRNVDERSDIWSLGAILHELVAGTPPFQADTITALCARILGEPPRPLTELRSNVPRALERIVLRCLEKEAAQRYANVAELARALSGFGSETAAASAVRIGRVVEGGIDAVPSFEAGSSPSLHPSMRSSPPLHSSMRSSLPRYPSRPLGISATELVDGLPPTPMKRARWGYALLAVVLIGGAGFAGFRLAAQGRDLRAAGDRLPRAELAIAPSPPAPVASPAASTADAVPAPPPVRPAPGATTATREKTPVAPADHAATERHAHSRRAAAPRAAQDKDDPFASEVESARPATATVPAPSLESLRPSPASPSPGATPAPTNPDELFDDRK